MGTWAVTDPAGVEHTKRSAARVYTHATIRRNIGSSHYIISWATSEAAALRESRVHASQRDYIAVVPAVPVQEQQS